MGNEMRPYAGTYSAPSGGGPPTIVAPDWDALLAVLQSIGRDIGAVKELLQRRVQKGIAYPYNIPVTAALGVKTVTFNPAFFGLVIINDGPGVIQYAMPSGSGTFAILNPLEVQPFGAEEAVIQSLAYGMAVGGGATSNLRLTGFY